MSVGSSPVRFDALSKTHGTAIYPGDRQLDDALVAKIVFTGQPHARLVSLDISAAEAVPGVVTVITAADVPCNEYGLTKFDQPVFISPTDDDSVAVATNVSRWEADHLAMVVAESLDAANAGAVAILAEWEQLALVPDIDAALDDTVLVHPQDGTNRYTHLKIRHVTPIKDSPTLMSSSSTRTRSRTKNMRTSSPRQPQRGSMSQVV